MSANVENNAYQRREHAEEVLLARQLGRDDVSGQAQVHLDVRVRGAATCRQHIGHQLAHGDVLHKRVAEEHKRASICRATWVLSHVSDQLASGISCISERHRSIAIA